MLPAVCLRKGLSHICVRFLELGKARSRYSGAPQHFQSDFCMIKKNMFQTCPNLLTGFETKREPTCATTEYLIACFCGPNVVSTQLYLSSSGSGTTVSWSLLEKPVGAKCLSSLLGIGQARLRKSAGGTPDLRYGSKEHRSRPGTWTVDGFLLVSYDSIAETLPDRLLTFDLYRSFMFHQNALKPQHHIC